MRAFTIPQRTSGSPGNLLRGNLRRPAAQAEWPVSVPLADLAGTRRAVGEMRR
jgi:hypothetical protein